MNGSRQTEMFLHWMILYPNLLVWLLVVLGWFKLCPLLGWRTSDIPFEENIQGYDLPPQNNTSNHQSLDLPLNLHDSRHDISCSFWLSRSSIVNHPLSVHCRTKIQIDLYSVGSQSTPCFICPKVTAARNFSPDSLVKTSIDQLPVDCYLDSPPANQTWGCSNPD